MKIAKQENGFFVVDGITREYPVYDFACKCCNKASVDESVLFALYFTEQCLGYPLHVNGCSRCFNYNTQIHGSARSAHLFDDQSPANAVDFERKDKPYADIWNVAVCNFSRVGIYLSKYLADDGSKQAYFHGDVKQPSLFWYRDASGYHYYKDPNACIKDFTEKVMKKI